MVWLSKNPSFRSDDRRRICSTAFSYSSGSAHPTASPSSRPPLIFFVASSFRRVDCTCWTERNPHQPLVWTGVAALAVRPLAPSHSPFRSPSLLFQSGSSGAQLLRLLVLPPSSDPHSYIPTVDRFVSFIRCILLFHDRSFGLVCTCNRFNWMSTLSCLWKPPIANHQPDLFINYKFKKKNNYSRSWPNRVSISMSISWNSKKLSKLFKIVGYLFRVMKSNHVN